MKVTEAQRRAIKKYDKKTVFKLTVRVPRSKKDLIDQCAKLNNESVNEMFNRLIDDEMKRKNII